MNDYALDATPIDGNQTLGAMGAAGLAIAATGTSVVAKREAGNARITIGATANPIEAVTARSNATIRLLATGASSGVFQGRGVASILFNGYANTAIGIQAGGEDVIKFGGAYAVPDRMPVPSRFWTSHISRILELGTDDRTVEIDADASSSDRTVTCEPDLRRILVTADKPIPVREKRTSIIQHEDRQA